jgi:hypothetical protein
MANEIQTQTTTGSAVYCVIRNSAALVWNSTAFVTFADGSWSTYEVPLTEQGTSGFFTANFPALITTADTYSVELWSGTGTESDQFVSGGSIQWNGSAVAYATTGTALASLAYVKDYCNITVTTYDSYLTNRINAASAEIQTWCNRTFPLTNYTENYDGPGSTILQLRQRPVTAVTSITTEFYSGMPTVIPSTEFVLNSRTGLVSVKPSSTYSYWFPYDAVAGQQSIQVVYTAGYSTIPQDIQEAVAKIVLNKFNALGADMTMMMEKIGDYQYTRRSDANRSLTPDIQAMLWSYKDIAV